MIKLTLDDLLHAESAVLDRIRSEIDGETDIPVSAHSSHSSGHNSSGGHYSSVARVESLDPKSETLGFEAEKSKS